MKILSTIFVGALLLQITSCRSPLDVDTKRIDTRLVNAIKLREVTVNARIMGTDDTLLVDPWSHSVAGSESFSVDTSSARLTMNYLMLGSSPASLQKPTLKEIHIDLAGISADGTVTLPATSWATIEMNGTRYTTTNGDNANASFHYRQSGTKEVQGTIVIGMDRTPLFSALIVINILGSQD